MINLQELMTQRKNLSEIKFVLPDLKEAVVKDLLKSPSIPFRKEEEIPFIRKFFVHEKATTEGLENGQVLHYISTVTVDRVGEVMEPKGADFKYYKRNPVVMWSHDYSDPDNIIGTNKRLETDDKGIVALTEFDLAEIKASKIYGLYKRGQLRGWSVGFIPVKGHAPKKDDEPEPKPGVITIDFNPPKPGEVRWIHDKWIMLEYSACAVPCNPDALTIAYAKQYDLPKDLIDELHIRAEEVLEGADVGSSGKTIFDLGGEGEKKEEGSQASAEGAPPEEEEEGDEGGCGCPKLTPEEIEKEYEKATPVTDEYVRKPYPNEHACRLRNPDDFQEGSFRTMERDHEGKKYRVILGRLKGEKTLTEQAYRYAKDTWSADEARTHCKDHEGKFEAASGKKLELEEAAMKLLIEGYLKEFREMVLDTKAGRVLSSKTRAVMTDTMKQMDEAVAAMKEARKAIGDLLETADAEGEEEKQGVYVSAKEEPEKKETVLELGEEDPSVKEIADQVELKDAFKGLVDEAAGSVK